jgi:hypothetical protein
MNSNIDLETFKSLPDDILERLYEEPQPIEVYGTEEFLKIPLNDAYIQNKISQNLDLNSNINIVKNDVKTIKESDGQK